MKLLRMFFRLLGVLGIVLLFIIQSSLAGLVIRNRYRLLKTRQRLVGRYSRFFLKVANIRFKNSPQFSKAEKLYVSNHLSYLDVIVIAARLDTLFITSTDIQSDWFLGLMSRLGAALFTNRRGGKALRSEISHAARALSEGHSVVVFPEATSGPGLEVLPFHPSAFSSALEAERPIVPLCLRYPLINKQANNASLRNYVCWYGEMKFFPHLMKLLQLDSVEVELQILPELKTNPDHNRKSIARSTWEMVSHAYAA